MPPLPAQVMMCELAKLVSLMSERVPVGVPRSVCAERVARVFDHQQVVAIGDRADRVPVGRVADEVRQQDRPRLRRDQLLDRAHVGVERVGLDVDEHRDETGADERRDVGRERAAAR